MFAATYALDSRRRRCRRSLIAGAWLLAIAARGRVRHRHGLPFRRGRRPLAPLLLGSRRGFRRSASNRRGDVRAAALLLLAESPSNGYQLMRKIDERSNGVWRPSADSIYPALFQLEDEGLVRVEEHDGRRTFVLTDSGRAYVEEHRTELGAAWKKMSGTVDDDVADLVGETKRIAIAALQIRHLGNSHQVAEARHQLAEVRRGLYALLAEDESAHAGGE